MQTLFFKSTDNKFYLMYAHLDYDEGVVLMIGLFEKHADNYLIVGSNDDHLFIKNNAFNFYDIHGFGGGFGYDTVKYETYIGPKSKPEAILNIIHEYYNIICENRKDDGEPMWS